MGGTRTLTQLLKETGRPLPFVYTSSVAVFGPRPGATAPLDADRDAPPPRRPLRRVQAPGREPGPRVGVRLWALPPARKFTHKPYYLGWYDTAKSQRLLTFQRRTFADYLEDYSDELARRFSRGFLPFMRRFVGPVWGRLIVERM